MITLDIFNDDAFSVTTMLAPVNKMPSKPGFLGSLGIFESESVATETVGVGMQNGRLTIIQTSQRGAPIEMAEDDVKNVRPFRIPRLAKGDKLRAAEISGVVPWPGQTDVDVAAAKLAEKQMKLRQDVEYTWERHRLGAVQGVLLDKDDSEIYDFYDEWGIAAPSEIDLDLDTADNGALRKEITASIYRPILRAAGDAAAGITRVIGLAGDDFFDGLISNPEVRKSYLNWLEAKELRGNDGGGAFDTFRYGKVDWINFKGSDDNSTISIDDDDAVIFPVGVPGMFRHVRGPGETMETVNRPGLDVYPLIVRDKDRDMWVQPEIYSYPLFLNTRPDLVLRATR